MAQQRSYVGQWLDVALYLPVGLLKRVQDELPQAVIHARQKADERVQVARWVGQMTVAYGRQELTKRLQGLSADVSDAPGEPLELTDEPLAANPPEPFGDYGSLPAAQIVQRLSGLPHAELHLVRAFETAHRGRRTVLAKVDQLLGDA